MAVIAISQQIGSRGIELGELAARELGYRFQTGDQLIAETAKRFNVSADQIITDSRTGGVTQVNRVGIRLYLSVGPGGPPAANFRIDALAASRQANGQPALFAARRGHQQG